jgi:thioredoxin 1
MIRSALKNICKLFLVVLLAIPVSGKAQNKTAATTQINFIENSWGEALKQAAAQRKYIFVDAYAVWCGPCKMLKRTTFKDKTVAAFFNKNFINLAMDMEQGQGPQLGSAWALEAYPTLLVFNSKGQRVLYSVGFIKAEDLLRFGKQALATKGK